MTYEATQPPQESQSEKVTRLTNQLIAVELGVDTTSDKDLPARIAERDRLLATLNQTDHELGLFLLQQEAHDIRLRISNNSLTIADTASSTLLETLIQKADPRRFYNSSDANFQDAVAATTSALSSEGTHQQTTEAIHRVMEQQRQFTQGLAPRLSAIERSIVNLRIHHTLQTAT